MDSEYFRVYSIVRMLLWAYIIKKLRRTVFNMSTLWLSYLESPSLYRKSNNLMIRILGLVIYCKSHNGVCCWNLFHWNSNGQVQFPQNMYLGLTFIDYCYCKTIMCRNEHPIENPPLLKLWVFIGNPTNYKFVCALPESKFSSIYNE